MKTFWLRAETKPFEERTPLTPLDAKKLMHSGAKIFIESSATRIFKDAEYKKIGCTIVPAQAWVNAESDPNTYILGLKEIPDASFPLVHKHIYFAHAYKGQDGASDLLKRFQDGKGTLFDLEFLIDQNQKRIAAFGKWAGFVGAAVAIDAFYTKHILKNSFSKLKSYKNKNILINELLSKKESTGITPKVIIIGAKGRCGNGALELLNSLGISATEWDYEETKKGGPFSEILEHDIFINAVLIHKKIKPFLTMDSLRDNSLLKIISDVSCDPTGELNPIPIYNESTTWEAPLLELNTKSFKLDVLSVDNLPSVLPKESSEDFSEQLLPHLQELSTEDNLSPVWKNSLNYFSENCQSI